MILGQDLLTEFVLNLKMSEHIVEVDYGPFIGFTACTVDLGAFLFKYLNTEKIKLK